MASLAEFNSLPAAQAEEHFLRCCHSKRWAAELCRQRPFSTEAELYLAADKVWHDLGHDDWLEAFSGHPKIGDVSSLRERFATTRQWAVMEQAGVGSANQHLLEALAEGNKAYEQKFGYIFIVCATGKGAAEILEILQKRLRNDRQSELIIAAEEQRKITRLRLEKALRS